MSDLVIKGQGWIHVWDDDTCYIDNEGALPVWSEDRPESEAGPLPDGMRSIHVHILSDKARDAEIEKAVAEEREACLQAVADAPSQEDSVQAIMARARASGREAPDCGHRLGGKVGE